MPWYYLSNPRMTCAVETASSKHFFNGIILTTPPILSKFKGQPLSNLLRWMRPDKRETLAP